MRPSLNGPYGGGGPRSLRSSMKKMGGMYEMWRAMDCNEMMALNAVAEAM